VSIEVAPATTARWDDVVAVMGTRGDPSRCWCQYFRLRGKQWSGSSPGTNREALHGQVADDAVPPGVVGYVDGEPAGWCATAPRTAYPRVLASPNWRTDADGAWAVTCFVVRTGRRRNGLARHLLAGAVDLAASHGATVVEGRAVDVSSRMSSADLYRGPLSVFLAEGFTVVRRSSPAWIQVRKDL
jgi:GNAT superfamily N-acetyltransferase